MQRHSRTFALTASALAVALLVAACGGGDAEPPPPARTTGGATGTADTTAPTIAMSDNVTGAMATADIVFTFTFSEAVGTTFTPEDIVVTGGSKGQFLRVGITQATLVVVPTPNSSGTVRVNVAANAVQDGAGNGNTAAVSASRDYNTVIPVVLTRLVSFDEATPPVFTGFGGAEDATVVTDPTAAGNKVARIVKNGSAELWAGTTVSICPNQALVRLPFTAANTRLSARVWSPDAGIPVRIKVEDAADGTKSVETEATVTMAAGWQTLVFDFASPAAGTAALNLANTYNKASVFFNFGTTGATAGAKTYYLDDLSFVGSTFTVACPATGGGGGTPPAGNAITFDEATPPSSTGFGGAGMFTIVNDPGNAANKVASILKAGDAELWAGTTIWTGAAESIPLINFTAANTTITARVYSPLANVPVRMKVEMASDNTKTAETEAIVTAANTWQTLSFNFANVAPGTNPFNVATPFNKMSVFFNFGQTGAQSGGARTYLIDAITFPAAAAGGGGGGGAGCGTTAPTCAPTTTIPAGSIIIYSDATTIAGLDKAPNWGQSPAVVFAEPTIAGNQSLKYTLGGGAAGLYQGIDWSGTQQDVSGKATMHLDVWSADVASVRVSLIGGGGENGITKTLTAGAWNSLDFDLAQYTSPDKTKVIQIKIEPNVAGTIYVDNLYFFGTAAGGGGGGGSNTFTGGIFSSDYSGNLGANTAKSDKGGNVGFFLDPRLFANKAFEDGSVCGSACNPGGVYNFYYGIGKLLPAITDGYFGAFVNAPGNGSADASAYSKVQLKFWGDAESWERPNFTANVDVILQGPANAACTNGSGRPEILRVVPAQKIGAGSLYTINKTDFTLAESCGGAYTVNSVWSAVGAVVVRLAGTNLQYVNTVNSVPVSYPTFINLGPISFVN